MVTHRVTMRNIGFMKPVGYDTYLTITEVSRKVDRDISWLRKLERDDRIPKAHRVQYGKLMIRLWSPAQVREIEKVIASNRPGRPKNG